MKENKYLIDTKELMKYQEVIMGPCLIEYGIIKGNNDVLYIKVGKGGNIYGYKNKYIEIAMDIHKKYDNTIIVASNPIEIKEEQNLDYDMNFINCYMQNNINKIYAFGHSNGGVVLCDYGYKYKKIEKILSINAPININLHKMKNGLLNSAADIYCIYGTEDPSFKYVDLLKNVNNISLFLIDGADHNFTNHYDEFRFSVEKYLFSNFK